jgi:hypothetical protein
MRNAGLDPAFFFGKGLKDETAIVAVRSRSPKLL